jgi:hypothetical protein
MPRARLLFAASVLLTAPSLPAARQCEIEVGEFGPPDGEAGDGFGYRVERAERVAVVAATFDDDRGLDSGSAYVYERDERGGWRLAAKILAPDGAAGDLFGYSVAVEGASVLVGAPGHHGSAPGSGKVYLFSRTRRGAWVLSGSLAPPSAGAGAGFGYSMAVREGRLLIGAPHHALGRPGLAYLYRRDAAAGGWTLELEFTSADPATALEFGQDVALGPGFLAVSGSETSVQPYSDTYVVHVRERDAGGPGAWGEVARLSSPTGARDFFGYEISAEGERLVAVAPGETDLRTSQVGALYLYHRSVARAGRWELERRLAQLTESHNPFAPDEVDVTGDWIVGGSFGHSAPGAPGAGAVFVFGRDVGGKDAWGSVARLLDEEPEANAFFGLDLELEGDSLLVGAPGTYTGAEAGEVYELDLARLARASWRSDAAERSLDVHRALTRPLLGAAYLAEVDLRATGHAFAVLSVYLERAEISLPRGQVRLGRGRIASFRLPGPVAHFALPLPADPALCGLELVTQAAGVGVAPFTLTNAQDLVLGFE